MNSSLIDVFKRDLRAGIKWLEITVRWRLCQHNKDSVLSIFKKIVSKNGNKIAIKYCDQKWTFRQLDDFSNRIANCFHAFGLKVGDEVALLMDNKPEYIGIWLGLAKAGVITAFINTNNRMDCLYNCFTAFNCKAIIYDGNYYPAIEEIFEKISERYPSMKYFVWSEVNNNNTNSGINCEKFFSQSFRQLLDSFSKSSLDSYHRRDFNDTLVYVFTSGTTGGKAKACIQTDSRLIICAIANKTLFGFNSNDNFYVCLPLYHVWGGVVTISQCLLNGFTLTIAKRFSASNFWSDCIKHECTIALYIGETGRYLLAQTPKPEDRQHSIRALYGNGLRGEFWRPLKTRFNIKHIYEVYGASESNIFLANIDDKEGSVGFIPYYFDFLLKYIFSAVVIKVDPISLEPVRDSKGLCRRTAPGDVGVIVGVIKESNALSNFNGYTDSGESKKKLIHNIRSVGDYGFMSGDLLEMDKFGYIYFKDRVGDTFRWKGENVSTTDVEAVLQNYLNLKECTVFGVSVGQCEGKAGMAVINAKSDDLDLNQLTQELVKHLPSYAIPLFIRLTNSLQMTATFKYLKFNQQKAGYNPSAGEDVIYYFDKNTQNYIKLTKELYNQIERGDIKL